jgi:2-C-methyl-D-erythritol 4-phosphate cytidylyltransferase
LIFSLLVPAAGSGERLGASIPKALIEITGKPMFVHAVLPFLGFPNCREVVIAAPAADILKFSEAAQLLNDDRVRVIGGGATRQESVRLSLESLTDSCDVVLVHDAARPYVTNSLIESVLDGLADCSACLPGLPVKDTVKQVNADGIVDSTLPRDLLFTVQTPQAIRAELFRQAHRLAAQDGWITTDDVALIEHYHLGKVRVVIGSELNFKITTPEDLQRAHRFPG